MRKMIIRNRQIHHTLTARDVVGAYQHFLVVVPRAEAEMLASAKVGFIWPSSREIRVLRYSFGG